MKVTLFYIQKFILNWFDEKKFLHGAAVNFSFFHSAVWVIIIGFDFRKFEIFENFVKSTYVSLLSSKSGSKSKLSLAKIQLANSFLWYWMMFHLEWHYFHVKSLQSSNTWQLSDDIFVFVLIDTLHRDGTLSQESRNLSNQFDEMIMNKNRVSRLQSFVVYN